MKQRSMLIMLALGATVLSQAQVSSINSVIVSQRYWNDYPGSNLTVTNNYPSSVIVTDNNVTSTGSGFANRHLVRFSNDGGVTPFAFDGGNDTFEVSANINVNSDAGPFTFPRRIEAGPWCRSPMIGGWWSEYQMILTNDGEVAAFGAPVPFYSFTTSQTYQYTQGTTVNIGYRYFRDTDNKMKWIYFVDGRQSPALTLENISGAEGAWNFGDLGFRPNGYTWNGGSPMPTEFGFYMQIMPNQGTPTTVNASLALSNLQFKEFGLKGTVNLMNITTNGDQEPVTVSVVDGGGNELQSMNTQLDHMGRFSFKSTVPAGTYDVYVKGATHLRKKVASVVVSATGANIGTVSLINGDVDGDNEIAPNDFSLLSGAFGTVDGDPGFLAAADLDRDGEVGPSDFSVLAGNFGVMGD